MPALTGVRGVAVIVVVIYHYLEVPYIFISNFKEPFAGYLAVDLFFVLSGFLMALNYGSMFSGNLLLSNFRLFLSRRFARVYPLYFVITLLTFAIAKAGIGGPYRWRTLASNLPLIQQLGLGMYDPTLGVSIVGPAWSISTELGAYLSFPLLFRLGMARAKGALPPLALSASPH